MATPTLLDPTIDAQAIERAADRLAAGHLLGLPTETVYGLGARADSDDAVAQIFQAKGRPSDHPLIVHVHDSDAALHFAEGVPPMARRLMDRFWPGPLTVIVPRRAGVGAAAAGGHPTIALRCPGHPVALALLKAAHARGVAGVAAPSANRFGRISPTRSAHVLSEFASLDLWVLEGGACEVGIESTIVDCTRQQAVVLRPGQIAREDLASTLQEVVGRSSPEAPDASAPRAAGTLLAHYAPRARLRLMALGDLRAALAQRSDVPPLDDGGTPAVAVYGSSVLVLGPAPHRVVMRPMPTQPERVAHELFATLRDLDDLGVGEIWVERLPDDPSWEGVRDRLTRAAAA